MLPRVDRFFGASSSSSSSSSSSLAVALPSAPLVRFDERVSASRPRLDPARGFLGCSSSPSSSSSSSSSPSPFSAASALSRLRRSSHRRMSSTSLIESTLFSVGEEEGRPSRRERVDHLRHKLRAAREEQRLLRVNQVPDVNQRGHRVALLDEDLLGVADPDRVLVIALGQALGQRGNQGAERLSHELLSLRLARAEQGDENLEHYLLGSLVRLQKVADVDERPLLAADVLGLEVVPTKLDELLAVSHELVGGGCG